MSVVALDIGTSRIKALLAHWDGQVEPVESAGTPTDVEAPGRLAFRADDVCDLSASLVSRLADAHPDDPVDTLVFSCLGTAMVPLDRDGQPLGPALSPEDVRPASRLDLLDELGLDGDRIFELTGQDSRVPSFLLHWLWWRGNHPAVMARLARFRSLRGFIAHELCGVDAEDPSWASRTMLMDLESDAWSTTILERAHLPAAVLPAIRPSTSMWPVGRAAGERFGLAREARVVLGGMDNCCSFLGASDPGEERLVNIAGTYEHMAGVGPLEAVQGAAQATDGLIHRYLLPGRFLSYSRVPLGHLLWQVAAAAQQELDRLLDAVTAEPIGEPIGLDADAVRDALEDGRPPASVAQRLFESVTAISRRYVEAWEGDGPPTPRIAAVGGGARPNLLQLKANLMGRSISTLSSDEGAALGALRLATMAVRGLSVEEACGLFPNPVRHDFDPHPAGRT